jgi:hypothetical protein
VKWLPALVCAVAALAQTAGDVRWRELSFLFGDWRGAGDGEPGKGTVLKGKFEVGDRTYLEWSAEKE